VTPGFFAGSTGSVFLSPGTSMAFGPVTAATLSTIVRTNFDPSLLPGDYNSNGTVDAADYVVWRKGLPAADGNNNSMIDPGDYGVWRENFGESAGPGAGAIASATGAVPEPATGIMLVFALISGSLARRQRTGQPPALPGVEPRFDGATWVTPGRAGGCRRVQSRTRPHDKRLRNFDRFQNPSTASDLQFRLVFLGVLFAYKIRRKKQLIEVETA
jgi:hypothetical protein